MTDEMANFETIGSSPPEEDCAQLGTTNYKANAESECFRYIELIRKVCGPEPKGARLAMKWFSHDFGRYAEVVCFYEDGNEASLAYTIHVMNAGPQKWDGTGGQPWVGK